MNAIESTCTFTGLRPHKMPPDTNLAALYKQLEEEIYASISAGYTIFQSGMAMGVDIEAAELVDRLKIEYPHIQLHCFLPCLTQADRWPRSWQERYVTLLERADRIFCLQKFYSRGCMLRRNQAMVERGAKLIAIHDGKTQGGTAFTIRYAQKRRVEVVVIHPGGYKKGGAQ